MGLKELGEKLDAAFDEAKDRVEHVIHGDDADARLLNEVLVIATQAAHKLSINRTVYKYEWMKQLSAEVVALEEQVETLKAICDERGIDWRVRKAGA